MRTLKKLTITLALLIMAVGGAWADDYTITLPSVSNGSVTAKVNDTPVTSAAAGATVSLVATPDAGYKLKTISAACNISETLSSGTNTRTGTYFRVSGDNIAQGWRVGNSAHYTLTISSLSNQNLSQVVLTVGGPKTATQRNISHLQVDHGAVSATGTAQGSTVTITGINSPTVVVSAPGSGNAASMWTFTQAKVDVLLGAITLTDTSDDNVKTFTMPSGNVTVSAEFEEPEITEWSLTPDETGKSWTLAKMPANNIELQVEYFAESNLFLSKNALADKTNIAVTAGDLGVQFGNDGKSANTITEGTPMTVKYNGTKKVIGFKVAKAAAPVYTLLSAATTSDYGKVVCAAGHLHDAKTAVPDGCTAVGILGKVTETGHGLIIALKDAPQQTWNTIDGWTSASYAGTTLKVLPDDAARGTNLTSYTTLGATTVSNWALAQKSDYQAIFQNLGTTNFDKVYDDNVNAYITGAGGTAMSGEFLSATPFQTSEFVEFFYIDEWGYGFKTTNFIVRPVLGF